MYLMLITNKGKIKPFKERKREDLARKKYLSKNLKPRV